MISVQDTTRWGLVNGRLVDTFDNNLDRIDGGSFVGGVGAGYGHVGGTRINFNSGRPGDIRNLYPCRNERVCSRRQIFPPRCEYTPVLLSSFTGGYCLGCPEDICQQVSNIDFPGGNLGGNVRGGGRNRQRGARRRQRRMRRIQRQACRLLGICDFQGQGRSGGRPFNTRGVTGNAGGFGGRRGGVLGNGGAGMFQGRRRGAVGNGGLDIFDGVVGTGIVGNVGRVGVNRNRSNIGGLLGGIRGRD